VIAVIATALLSSSACSKTPSWTSCEEIEANELAAWVAARTAGAYAAALRDLENKWDQTVPDRALEQADFDSKRYQTNYESWYDAVTRFGCSHPAKPDSVSWYNPERFQ
jgi:hypothetical protein